MTELQRWNSGSFWQAAGDPDSEYLGEMASSGIPLGTQGFPAV
jgi:hypothetical protein